MTLQIKLIIIERKNVTHVAIVAEFLNLKNRTLPTAICNVERWKKITGYRFVPKENRTFKEVRQQIVAARSS